MRQPRPKSAAVSAERALRGVQQPTACETMAFGLKCGQSLLRPMAFVMLIVLCCVSTIEANSGSRVHVDPHTKAYKGLVVAISPKIKPHLGKTIIPNLEVSQHLETAWRTWIWVVPRRNMDIFFEPILICASSTVAETILPC